MFKLATITREGCNSDDQTMPMPAAFSTAVSSLPTPLAAEVAGLAEQILDRQPDNFDRLLKLASHEVLVKLWACSPFIARYCADPERLRDLLDQDHLTRELRRGELSTLAQQAVLAASEAERQRRLRQLRHREMVRIAWRDLCRLADLEETMRDLSALADACICAAADSAYSELAAQWGSPCNAAGTAQELVVIAMGKLGAGELNFSSDIDLIFCYPQAGNTRSGPRSLSNEEFFQRQGQRLIKSLNAVTEDGFVFRVDMRLRPFGDSGPLVASFDALETYYSAQARDWERYAMVKARIVTGTPATAEQLQRLLKPFVYRRYLDFGAFEALREMKRMIEQEIRRKGIEQNIKLGPGGIREIEFIAQSFQLIRGGRQPLLQDRRLLSVLSTLGDLGYLSAATVTGLQAAYRFLRETEHRLQEQRDEQTQMLPTDPLDQARLAISMGYPSYVAFSTDLQAHRQLVQHEFGQLLVREQTPSGTPVPGASPWPGMTDPELLAAWLRNQGCADPEGIAGKLLRLGNDSRLRHLSRVERERLERLMPVLLRALQNTPEPARTMDRILPIIETTLHRSVYLALLWEHRDALTQLLDLAAASPWIASYITRHPILLDELIDPRVLYRRVRANEFEPALRATLAQVNSGDLEQEIDRLRQFKHAQVLHIAAADIRGLLSVAEVSDFLSAVADSVVCTALRLAWRDLTAKFGIPQTQDPAGTHRDAEFAIIAYGKLGGYELGYGSDLDLVFLHDDSGEGCTRHPQKSIANAVFFARLGQRIIHILGVATPAGQAYEIDTRLRPSGSAGLLVSSLEAYRNYQNTQAWTWEHQALVRARALAGPPAIRAEFDAIRATVLAQERDPGRLHADIVDMRIRMRTELDRSDAQRFDLKQGQGGITDIEFMVQYLVLLHAAQCPLLLQATSNRGLLELFAGQQLLPYEDCEALLAAYFALRKHGHALALQQEPARVANTDLTEQRQNVRRIWQQLLE